MARASSFEVKVLSICLCIAAGTLFSGEAIDFNIPADSLSEALKTFSKQSNTQVGVSSDLVKDKKSVAVVGRMSAPEAITRLLGANTLTVKWLSVNAVALSEPQPTTAPTLPEVVVEGTKTKPVAATNALPSPATPARPYVAEKQISATKTDLPISQTPASISVVTRAMMDDQRAVELDEALQMVAGVKPGGYYNGFDYYRIRGFDGAFNTFRDGLRSDIGGIFSEEVFGAERIEVLKGPASVLYGQSVLGGLVNVVSKKPQKERHGEFEVVGGNYEYGEANLDVGGKLNKSGTVYARMVAIYRHQNTFTHHIEPTQRMYIAPSISWEPTDKTKVTFLAQNQQDWLNIAFPLPAEGTVLPNPNGEIPIHRSVGEHGNQNRDFLKRTELTYELDHEFNDLISLHQVARGSWNQYDFSGIYPTTGDNGDYLQDDKRTLNRYRYAADSWYWIAAVDTNLKFNFDTGIAKHTLLFGVDYNHIKDDSSAEFGDVEPLDLFAPTYGTPLGKLVPFQRLRSNRDNVGVYIQEQVRLLDKLTVLLGGRYDWAFEEERDVFNNSKSSKENDAFSPRAGVLYEFLPKCSLYASYSESFRAQFGQSADGSPVDPETGQQYEAGVKIDLLKGRAQSTFAFYDLKRQNVATADPTNPAFVVLTGEQRSRGFEWEGAFQPARGFELTFAYSYVDAEITKDNFFPVGDRQINVPEHNLSIWARYTLQEGTAKGLGFGVGGRYYSDQAGDLPNTFDIPDYGLVDLTIDYKWKRFKFAIDVNNIFDRRYTQGSYDRGYVLPGDPLSVRASFGWKFW